MGFGDFAMGYLVGQSFSGPNHIPDGSAPYSEWSSQAKKDWDKKCDEVYWEAWDRAFKEKVIERLRNHEEGAIFYTSIYPNMTQDEQADLIERGEWKIVAPTQGAGNLSIIWANENRKEAKDPKYLEKLAECSANIKNHGYRIIN
ncbi:hypothetical protein [Helicobacter labetoulli]|uniref:hypothetical protein n=1 Tax=Helicobacter labetoulli TaxID=2315333 RepID=UPI000EF74D05|nr:hypothetical protein [Helicobacter labetoulli]